VNKSSCATDGSQSGIHLKGVLPNETERGCVVLDQPQHIKNAMLRRLVFDTPALRGSTRMRPSIYAG
jgi:hypothetical protein